MLFILARDGLNSNEHFMAADKVVSEWKEVRKSS